MFKWLVRRRLAAFEKQFDYNMDYAREILDATGGGFLRFSFLPWISGYRERVPRDAWFAANIVATISEDCGPCTQLVVTMAEKQGASAAVLRAVVARDLAAMGPDAALAFRFAKSVLERDLPESGHLREEVVARWGRNGLVSLALAMAVSRTFPTIKYALGHGRECSRVRIAGADLPVAHASLAAPRS